MTAFKGAQFENALPFDASQSLECPNEALILEQGGVAACETRAARKLAGPVRNAINGDLGGRHKADANFLSSEIIFGHLQPSHGVPGHSRAAPVFDEAADHVPPRPRARPQTDQRRAGPWLRQD